MKKQNLIFLILFIISFTSTAQLEPVGSDVLYTNKSIGVGTTTPSAKLHIGANSGENLLWFGTDRPWCFTTSGSGAGERLQLKNSSNDKYFDIANAQGENIASFFASSTTNKVFLLGSGGNAYIGSSTSGANLDIKSGNLKPLMISTTYESPSYKDQIQINGTMNSPYGIAFAGLGHHRGGIYAENTGGTSSNAGRITIWSRNSGLIYLDGKVGIRTNNPQYDLHVATGARTRIATGGPSTSAGAIGDFVIATSDGGLVNNSKFWFMSYRNDTWGHSVGDLVFYSRNEVDYTIPLIMQTDGDVLLVTGNGAARNGNVGIGTMEIPSGYKLAVNGAIAATKVTIKTENSWGWPDYVFAEDYALKPLSDVKDFIEENKHLPEVPSAADVEQEGVNLGEMDAILLKKIEELTLYMIEQQSINETQQSTIEAQNTVIIELQNQIQELKR